MKLPDSKCVYVFHNPLVGYTKIGVSKSLLERRETIERVSGMSITHYYSTYPLSNYKDIESKAHDYFAESRCLGEWFNIDPKDAKDYLISVFDKYVFDSVFRSYKLGLSVSSIARSFGVSRAAINNHIDKLSDYIEDSLELPENKKDFGLRLDGEVVYDVPMGAKNIKKHIYKYNDDYYVKKFHKGGWRILKFEDELSCEACLDGMK